MGKLKNALFSFKHWMQNSLFPAIEEEVGELTEDHEKVVAVLAMVRIEAFIARFVGLPGRPQADRVAIARSFIAKMVFRIATTKSLVERLAADPKLRRICGWNAKAAVPSESTFSRAFAEFAGSELPARVQEALIKKTLEDRIVGHLRRDGTAIKAREKPPKKLKTPGPKVAKKRGRPRKGEEKPEELTRLERHVTMPLQECLDDLPKQCDVGAKKNSKGNKETWIGYKLHIDSGDGDIPISCILTSASVHDSQVAIALAKMTNERVTSLYDLMDSAYDNKPTRDFSTSLGHVPIIDVNPRSNKELKEEIAAEAKRRGILNFKFPDEIRYNERSGAERVNARLKDDYGATTLRVRGHAKVYRHLTFGILALAADQLLQLIS